MDLIELLLTAVGLSMDAFAVAMCKGLSMRRFRIRNAVLVGVYFGVFQALMPLIGYFVGINFAGYIEAFDHWIAFALLVFLGIRMAYESFGDADEANDALDFETMLVLSVATSIDALAAGFSFAVLKINIFSAVAAIGAITFALSALGVKIGAVFGEKYKRTAELCSGIILIGIGVRILFEHLLV